MKLVETGLSPLGKNIFGVVEKCVLKKYQGSNRGRRKSYGKEFNTLHSWLNIQNFGIRKWKEYASCMAQT
jgi:hypothetical protein